MDAFDPLPYFLHYAGEFMAEYRRIFDAALELPEENVRVRPADAGVPGGDDNLPS
jgi:hypothetical protein